jgi:membrane-bound serine protease (ClpP class)
MVDQDAELVEIRENGSVRFEINETGGGSASAGADGSDETDGGEGAGKTTKAGDDSETAGTGKSGNGGDTRRRVISPSGKLLTLTAGEMEEYGISSGTISDLQALFEELEIDTTLEVAPSGADQIVGFLSSAAVTSMLLTIGLLALYLEISSPGFGLPGTVAVLAFAVIFFSGGLLGTLGSVELILFLLGVVLLVVEIFLIPGFGVAGISGLLLMSIGLILSRQGFVLPESDWQWEIFFQNLAVVFGTFALSFILMGVLMIFFPRIRLFRRLILSTTSGGGVQETDGFAVPAGADKGPGGDTARPPRDGGADAGATDTSSAETGGPKVGDTGTVKTKLRPAGRIEIDGENYSVVTDGEWIEPGEEVKVIEVAGNRIVVERSE